jgi:hypothetical protein
VPFTTGTTRLDLFASLSVSLNNKVNGEAIPLREDLLGMQKIEERISEKRFR